MTTRAPGCPSGVPYPGETQGQWIDRDFLEEKFLERSSYQRGTGTPIWVGEFGPVYTGDPERDEQRYQILSDQLDIYDRYGAGWSIWTYKDVGLQGLVHAAPDSPYMERFGALIEKKARLGIDSWGSTDQEVPEVVEPVHELIAREFPGWSPYPWSPRATTDDVVRHILFAQAMPPSTPSASATSPTTTSTSWPTRSPWPGARRGPGCATCWPRAPARRPSRPDHHITKGDLMSRSNLSRRAWACGSALALVLMALAAGPAQAHHPRGLRHLTARPLIGTAVNTDLLGSDATYTAILDREFNSVTPENAMKWESVEAQRGVLDFSAADRLVAHARAHRQIVRGHTLVWSASCRRG
jgi:Glycosyl hydrolase family 10